MNNIDFKTNLIVTVQPFLVSESGCPAICNANLVISSEKQNIFTSQKTWM